MVFHHCMDIWASISSIFLIVFARSSSFEGVLLWKKEGLAVKLWPVDASCLRILRSMSNSRLRTKSFRRLRSIISLSNCLLSASSRLASLWSRSDQLVAGLRTNFTTLESKPDEASSFDIDGVLNFYGCKSKQLIELPLQSAHERACALHAEIRQEKAKTNRIELKKNNRISRQTFSV